MEFVVKSCSEQELLVTYHIIQDYKKHNVTIKNYIVCLSKDHKQFLKKIQDLAFCNLCIPYIMISQLCLSGCLSVCLCVCSSTSHVCLNVCLSVCFVCQSPMFVCPFFCVFVCLAVCLSIFLCLFVHLGAHISKF